MEDTWKIYSTKNKTLRYRKIQTVDNRYIVAIGDVHGCIKEYTELINKIDKTYGMNNCCLISLGDLVHRGPDSQACLEQTLTHCNFMILGNHEEKHSRWFIHDATKGVGKNPVRLHTEEAVKIKSDTLHSYMLQSLHWLKVNNTIFVHGGMMPHIPYECQEPKLVIRLREMNRESGKVVVFGDKVTPAEPWYEFHTRPERIVYGHSVWNLNIPVVKNNTYGIDNGVVFGGNLTAYIEDTETNEVSFLQVKAKQTYYEMNNYE